MFRLNTSVSCQQDTKNVITRHYLRVNKSGFAGDYGLTGDQGSAKPGAARAVSLGRLRLKCDGTRAETKFRLSTNRTSAFKSAGASIQSTTGSRGVCISGCNAGYTMFRGSAKSTGYPIH